MRPKFDKAAIKTAKSFAKNCKCFLYNKNLCNNKNFKMLFKFKFSLFLFIEIHLVFDYFSNSGSIRNCFSSHKTQPFIVKDVVFSVLSKLLMYTFCQLEEPGSKLR